MINEFFDHVFYINLDRRPDRREGVEAELARVGILAERFPAIDGKQIEPDPTRRVNLAELGCLISHRLVMEEGVKRGYDRFLVLEDDVTFLGDPNQRVRETAVALPSDWDMLYLSGNHVRPPVRHGQLWRCTKTYTTTAYGVTGKFARSAVDLLARTAWQVDVALASTHVNGRSYTIYPGCCTQLAGHSDIQGCYVNYRQLIK